MPLQLKCNLASVDGLWQHIDHNLVILAVSTVRRCIADTPPPPLPPHTHTQTHTHTHTHTHPYHHGHTHTHTHAHTHTHPYHHRHTHTHTHLHTPIPPRTHTHTVCSASLKREGSPSAAAFVSKSKASMRACLRVGTNTRAGLLRCACCVMAL